MRELTVSAFMTLDGVVQAPGGPGEDDDGGFAYGGWSVPYWDDRLAAFMGETMSPPFDIVLGRRTYDIFAAYWPDAPEDEGGKLMADATKYVASRGQPDLSWVNSVQLEGDAAEAVAALKAGDGPPLQVHGSSNLLRTLMAAGLVDRYRLLIYPVVLGTGKRLFVDGTFPSALRLVDSDVSPTGVVLATYERAGEVQAGSFE